MAAIFIELSGAESEHEKKIFEGNINLLGLNESMTIRFENDIDIKVIKRQNSTRFENFTRWINVCDQKNMNQYIDAMREIRTTSLQEMKKEDFKQQLLSSADQKIVFNMSDQKEELGYFFEMKIESEKIKVRSCYSSTFSRSAFNAEDLFRMLISEWMSFKEFMNERFIEIQEK